MTTKTATTTSANLGSKALLALIVESAGVFLAVMIAGMSPDAGTLVVIFMVGILLVFLVMHASQVNEAATWILNVEKNA